MSKVDDLNDCLFDEAVFAGVPIFVQSARSSDLSGDGFCECENCYLLRPVYVLMFLVRSYSYFLVVFGWEVTLAEEKTLKVNALGELSTKFGGIVCFCLGLFGQY